MATFALQHAVQKTHHTQQGHRPGCPAAVLHLNALLLLIHHHHERPTDARTLARTHAMQEMHTLVGIDLDPAAHRIAAERLEGALQGRPGFQMHLLRGNYRCLPVPFAAPACWLASYP